jgi:hypothetical protein
MINKKQYPINLLKNVQDLYQKIRKIANDNSDVIAVATNTEFEIQLKDVAELSDFNGSNERGNYAATHAITVSPVFEYEERLTHSNTN